MNKLPVVGVNISILAVRKVGHLNRKTKMFGFEAHILIGWLARVFANKPIRTRAFLSASITLNFVGYRTQVMNG